MSTATDAELVAGCRDGSESAWSELVERYSGYVYAIVGRGFGLRGHEAEDVFQETFARLHQNIDSLREAAAVKGWIAQTARRLAIDHKRTDGRETPVEADELDPEGVPDPQLERLDEALTVRAGLEEISEQCREVLTRFFLRDESYRAIAEATDLAAGTIASRISRCLVKLREALEGRNLDSAPS